MRIAVWVLVAGLLLGGCAGRTKVTQYQAVECLQMSMGYKNLVRQAGGPVTLAVKRDEEDRIQIVALAHEASMQTMLGRFRVEQDGRIFHFIEETGQWKWISTCE